MYIANIQNLAIWPTILIRRITCFPVSVVIHLFLVLRIDMSKFIPRGVIPLILLGHIPLLLRFLVLAQVLLNLFLFLLKISFASLDHSHVN